MREQDPESSVLCELRSMIVHLLRTPPLPLPFPVLTNAASSSSKPTSPAAFGSLFLGISVALMLFGSVAFCIGFILMPLVTALVMLFFFAGFIATLSQLGRSILFHCCPEKHGPAWDYEVEAYD